MKKLPGKSASQPQHLTKTSTINSAEHEASLLRLQVCFFLSGAAGLIDQVVWTKALGQLFAYSAYAVATVLALFLGGLAVGSALFARWRPLRKNGVALYTRRNGIGQNRSRLDAISISAAKFRGLLTPLPTDAEHQVLRARLEIAERQYANAAKDLQAPPTK